MGPGLVTLLEPSEKRDPSHKNTSKHTVSTCHGPGSVLPHFIHQQLWEVGTAMVAVLLTRNQLRERQNLPEVLTGHSLWSRNLNLGLIPKGQFPTTRQ